MRTLGLAIRACMVGRMGRVGCVGCVLLAALACDRAANERAEAPRQEAARPALEPSTPSTSPSTSPIPSPTPKPVPEPNAQDPVAEVIPSPEPAPAKPNAAKSSASKTETTPAKPKPSAETTTPDRPQPTAPSTPTAPSAPTTPSTPVETAPSPAPKQSVTIPQSKHVRVEVPARVQSLLDADTRMQPWLQRTMGTIEQCYTELRSGSPSVAGTITLAITMHENARPDADVLDLPPALSGIVACATGKLMRAQRMPLFTGKEGERHTLRVRFSP